MSCKFLADTSGYPFMRAKNSLMKYIAKYYEPVQGSFKNCPLVSALSSIAWVNDAIIPGKTASASYSFTFYDYEPRADQYPGQQITVPMTAAVSVNSNIWKDSDSGVVCCSRGSNETWVAMIEKAYAKFCMFKFAGTLKFADLQNASVEPVFSDLPTGDRWGGNTAYVMRNLTKNATKTVISIAGDAGVYDKIKLLCPNYDVIGKIQVKIDGVLLYINGCMIQYPAGACTYRDEDAAFAGNGGQKVSYNNSSIAADHCYSLLGIYEAADVRYLVLRNPCGADPLSIQLGAGPWIISQRLFKVAGYAPSTDKATGLKFDFGAADGVFALDEKTFRDYFASYGYIG